MLFLCIFIDSLGDALQLILRFELGQVMCLLDLVFRLVSFLTAAVHSSVQYGTGFLVEFLDGLKTGT